MVLVGLLGLVGSVITLIVGFLPPGSINVGSDVHYELSFSGGLCLMILPVIGFFVYQRFSAAEISIPVSLSFISLSSSSFCR